MAKTTFKGIRISAMAGAVPAARVDNLKDHGFVSAEDSKKIVSLTGVREYRKTPPEICTSDLCFSSAEALLGGIGLDPASIDAIIFASMTPDYVAPSTACVLQDRLGCPQSTLAYDINMGCSGFMVGLYNACSLIKGAGLKRVLLLAGDTQTKLCHDEDKNVVFILGDGGTATVVEDAPGAEDITMELFTDGARFKSLYVPAGGCRAPSTDKTREVSVRSDGSPRSDENLFMDGMEIFKFSSSEVVKSMQSFMDASNLSSEDFDYLVLHQANKFMNDKIARKLKFSREKLPYSIDVYGNTAAGSIPLTIAHKYDEMKGSGKVRSLLCGFGVGLSWGIADLCLADMYCPGVMEV